MADCEQNAVDNRKLISHMHESVSPPLKIIKGYNDIIYDVIYDIIFVLSLFKYCQT